MSSFLGVEDFGSVVALSEDEYSARGGIDPVSEHVEELNGRVL